MFLCVTPEQSFVPWRPILFWKLSSRCRSLSLPSCVTCLIVSPKSWLFTLVPHFPNVYIKSASSWLLRWSVLVHLVLSRYRETLETLCSSIKSTCAVFFVSASLVLLWVLPWHSEIYTPFSKNRLKFAGTHVNIPVKCNLRHEILM